MDKKKTADNLQNRNGNEEYKITVFMFMSLGGGGGGRSILGHPKTVPEGGKR